MRHTKLAAVIFLVTIAAILASACGGGGKAGTNESPTMASSGISKPKPIVMLVNATTAGVFDNYYAILDISVKNDGADGVVIVVGTISQGTSSLTNEIPVYLTQGTMQTVKLVFHLKWRGGEWTPSVQTEVP